MTNKRSEALKRVLDTFRGSDGDATKALYADLAALGPPGEIAVNLFRAQKCSARAKVYRGGVRGQGSYRGMAYERKSWAIGNLCRILGEHAGALGIVWGWREDFARNISDPYRWVLYVELPNGQVSFHNGGRGEGPIFDGEWDGERGLSPQRVCCFVADVLAERTVESCQG